MSRFERWSVWITTALTAATGIGYFWTKYLLEPSNPFAVINHPLQPVFLKAHILVSPLLLLALGMISLRHVWQHFRSGIRWSRRSGLTTAASVLPMVLTGYLIQTFTAAGWVRAMALSHIGFGTLYLVGIGLHQASVRKGRGRRAGTRDAGRAPLAEATRVGEARAGGAPAPRRVRGDRAVAVRPRPGGPVPDGGGNGRLSAAGRDAAPRHGADGFAAGAEPPSAGSKSAASRTHEETSASWA